MGIVFPYTRAGPTYRKPLIYGVLRHGGRFTPPVNMLVDTGSDHCIFDSLLVKQLLGMDPVSVGKPAVIQGLEGNSQAHVCPIELHIRDLDMTLNIEQAYFCRLSGLSGILGDHGFLDRLIVTFSRAKSFEIDW